MAQKLFDVNSGSEFTPSKANSVMKAPSPLCKGSGSKESRKMMDTNSGGYKEVQGGKGAVKASFENGMK